MKKFYLLIINCLFIVVAGCDSIQKYGSNGQYQQDVETTKSLEVPQGLSSNKLETYYKVPAIKNSKAPAQVSILPPGSKVTK